MIKFERTLVYEPFVYEAVLGARLSYASGEKSDSCLFERDRRFSPTVGQHNLVGLEIGPSDEDLLKRLLTGALGENKFRRSIPVSVFITAPLRWWFDADTYKIGTVKQSSSLMHYFRSRGRLEPGHFTEFVDPRVLEVVNELFDDWNSSGEGTNGTSEKWLKFQDNIPRGVLYTAHWTANYEVLAYAMKQRRNHRQRTEWRAFCDWAESLPHSWLMTYEKPKKEL